VKEAAVEFVAEGLTVHTEEGEVLTLSVPEPDRVTSLTVALPWGEAELEKEAKAPVPEELTDSVKEGDWEMDALPDGPGVPLTHRDGDTVPDTEPGATVPVTLQESVELPVLLGKALGELELLESALLLPDSLEEDEPEEEAVNSAAVGLVL